jgi:predicted nucleic acid-binding protein
VTIVANAGPLIALARIQHLHLLPALYDEIVIPPAVLQELTSDVEQVGAQELAQAAWLHVVEVEDQAEIEVLRSSLDQGESEAIILARQLQATLLIDERRGRTLAAGLGVTKTGTIGVLIDAKQAGLVASVSQLLDGLREAGVRLSPRIYEEARRLASEL